MNIKTEFKLGMGITEELSKPSNKGASSQHIFHLILSGKQNTVNHFFPSSKKIFDGQLCKNMYRTLN